MEQGESRFTSGTVRTHRRIPVVVEDACLDDLFSELPYPWLFHRSNHRISVMTSHFPHREADSDVHEK
jgi:hypothetical protein